MKQNLRLAFSVGWLPCMLFVLGCSQEPSLDESATQFVEAKQALADGDKDKALELLTSSIEARPDPWALWERAKIYAENGADDDAQADIDAGLELDPEHSDLLWLQNEMKKRPTSRFKGRSREPPSA